MVVFGDAFSDVGNVHGASNETQAPGERSWQGRCSDGPVWNEYVLASYFDMPIMDTASNNNYSMLGEGRPPATTVFQATLAF
jgi:hypothetical protein